MEKELQQLNIQGCFSNVKSFKSNLKAFSLLRTLKTSSRALKAFTFIKFLKTRMNQLNKNYSKICATTYKFTFEWNESTHLPVQRAFTLSSVIKLYIAEFTRKHFNSDTFQTHNYVPQESSLAHDKRFYFQCLFFLENDKTLCFSCRKCRAGAKNFELESSTNLFKAF